MAESSGAAAGLQPWVADAWGAQERGADGGRNGAGSGAGAAPIAASFRRQRAVVG